MKFWVDAQLPPQLAAWLATEFRVEASSLRDLGLRDAADLEIFQQAAIQPGIVLISKDSDFVDMVSRFGPPPQVALGNMRQRHQAPFADRVRQRRSGRNQFAGRRAGNRRDLLIVPINGLRS